jgi:hypothetical protein
MSYDSLSEEKNLLLALHKFTHRSEKGQTHENFTSTVFAHALEYFQNKEQSTAVLILKCLLPQSMEITESDCARFRISARENVEGKIPDLVIEGSGLLAFVEVKVDQPPNRTQLDNYRARLDRRADAHRKCLVLLTRDPVDGNSESLVDKHVIWHQVAEVIKTNIGHMNTETGVDIAAQLWGFLKGRGMVMEHVDKELAEGFRSLFGLERMLQEGITRSNFAVESRTRFLDEKEQWAGYYFWIGEKHCWVGIYLADTGPGILCFQVERNGGWDTVDTLNFNGEAFFSLTLPEQRSRIQQFIGDCCAKASRDPEANGAR